MKLKIITLYFIVVLILLNTTYLSVASETSNSQGLHMTFRVAHLSEGIVNSRLAQATISLYDKNKNKLGSKSISPNNYNKEYGQFDFRFDVPNVANDIFFVTLDSKSDSLSPIDFSIYGNMELNKFIEFKIDSFYGNPESGGGIQLTGDASNPISISAFFLQKPDELLVETTINGILADGLEFAVIDPWGTTIEVEPTKYGLLHVPTFAHGDYSIKLKEGQNEYLNGDEIFKINKSGYGPSHGIRLKKSILHNQAPQIVTNIASEKGYNNFINVNKYNSFEFSDFTSNDWFSSYVEYAYEKGIILGKGQGTFDPQGNLTIAEAITLASKINKIYNGLKPTFDNVGTNWYDGAVNYAINQKIVNSTEFLGKYNSKTTRAQMIYIFSQALPEDAYESINEQLKIPDVDENTKYHDKIQMFYDSGIIDGSDSLGTFKPSSHVTRAEAATIICKVANPDARKVREIVEGPEVATNNLEESTLSIDLESEPVQVDKNIYYAKIINDGKVSYINKEGEYVKGKYFDQVVDKFVEGVAIIRNDNKYGFISSDGEYLYEPQFDSASSFSEGMARIRVNKLDGFVSKDFDTLIIPKFKNAGNFSEGLARVKEDVKWGYIDKKGQYAIDPIFDSAHDFSEGLAVVRVDGKAGYIDKTGVIVIKPQFAIAGQFSEGRAMVSINGMRGYINKQGKYIFEPQFTDASNFSDGMAIVNGKDGWGFINQSNQYILKLEFQEISKFSEGLAVVSKFVKIDDNYSTLKSGVINKKGDYVFDADFNYIGDFLDGLARVNINGKYGFINKNGDIVIKAQYESAREFSNGLAAVYNGSKWGYINNEGKFLIEPQFMDAYGFEHIE